MTTKTYQLETLVCPSCMAKIEGALKRINGIENPRCYSLSKAKVTFDESVVDSDTIKRL